MSLKYEPALAVNSRQDRGVPPLRSGFTEMCSGSEAGSYLRLIDVVYHSTPGLRVINEKKKKERRAAMGAGGIPLLPFPA